MAFRNVLKLVPQVQNIRRYSKKEGDPRYVNREFPPTFSRTGDTGTSKTLGREVLPKDHRIFNAIGATEELLSSLGLAREHALEQEQLFMDKLMRIQTIVIDISTAISRSGNGNGLKQIGPELTQELEEWIEKYSKELPPAEQYVIPGGGVSSSSLHLARSICRRAEREVTPFVREGLLDKEALVYLNRLSDLLFTLSRIAAKRNRRTETIYIPKPDETVQEQ